MLKGLYFYVCLFFIYIVYAFYLFSNTVPHNENMLSYLLVECPSHDSLYTKFVRNKGCKQGLWDSRDQASTSQNDIKVYSKKAFLSTPCGGDF